MHYESNLLKCPNVHASYPAQHFMLDALQEQVRLKGSIASSIVASPQEAICNSLVQHVDVP